MTLDTHTLVLAGFIGLLIITGFVVSCFLSKR